MLVCELTRLVNSNTMTAGGVTIYGLQLITVPRHLKEKPSLHHMSFIPFDQTNTQTHQRLIQENLVIQDITEEEEMDGPFRTLLKTFSNKGEGVIDEDFNLLTNDPILRKYINPDQFQNYLGIVAENSPALSLDVLFVEPGALQSKFSPKLALEHAASKSPIVQYRIVNCPIGTSGVMEKETIELDQLSTNGLNKFHVVVINAISLCSPKMNMDDAIEKISPVLKDQGFVMLLEPSGYQDFVRILCRVCGGTKDEIEDVQPNSPNTIKEEFEKAGYEQVAVAESGSLVTEFLFRKRSKAPKDYSVVKVEPDGFKWVNDLKINLKNSKENKNIWLIAPDGPFSGLVGCVNCLKLEPNGDKIR